MNKIEITLEALKQQRNQALDAVAFLNGEVAERDAMIENLKTQIDQMEKSKLVGLPETQKAVYLAKPFDG